MAPNMIKHLLIHDRGSHCWLQAAALAVLLLLPETNGVNMPETLLDVRRMEKSALYFWIKSKVCGSRCCGGIDGTCNREEKESLL